MGVNDLYICTCLGADGQLQDTSIQDTNILNFTPDLNSILFNQSVSKR